MKKLSKQVLFISTLVIALVAAALFAACGNKGGDNDADAVYAINGVKDITFKYTVTEWDFLDGVSGTKDGEPWKVTVDSSGVKFGVIGEYEITYSCGTETANAAVNIVDIVYEINGLPANLILNLKASDAATYDFSRGVGATADGEACALDVDDSARLSAAGASFQVKYSAGQGQTVRTIIVKVYGAPVFSGSAAKSVTYVEADGGLIHGITAEDSFGAALNVTKTSGSLAADGRGRFLYQANTFVYAASDAAGNENTFTQTVTVNETGRPSFTAATVDRANLAKTLNTAGYSLQSVFYNGAPLQGGGDDYFYGGNQFAFQAEYLAALSDGPHDFDMTFDTGWTEWTVTVADALAPVTQAIISLDGADFLAGTAAALPQAALAPASYQNITFSYWLDSVQLTQPGDFSPNLSAGGYQYIIKWTRNAVTQNLLVMNFTALSNAAYYGRTVQGERFLELWSPFGSGSPANSRVEWDGAASAFKFVNAAGNNYSDDNGFLFDGGYLNAVRALGYTGITFEYKKETGNGGYLQADFYERGNSKYYVKDGSAWNNKTDWEGNAQYRYLHSSLTISGLVENFQTADIELKATETSDFFLIFDGGEFWVKNVTFTKTHVKELDSGTHSAKGAAMFFDIDGAVASSNSAANQLGIWFYAGASGNANINDTRVALNVFSGGILKVLNEKTLNSADFISGGTFHDGGGAGFTPVNHKNATGSWSLYATFGATWGGATLFPDIAAPGGNRDYVSAMMIFENVDSNGDDVYDYAEWSVSFFVPNENRYILAQKVTNLSVVPAGYAGINYAGSLAVSPADTISNIRIIPVEELFTGAYSAGGAPQSVSIVFDVAESNNKFAVQFFAGAPAGSVAGALGVHGAVTGALSFIPKSTLFARMINCGTGPLTFSDSRSGGDIESSGDYWFNPYFNLFWGPGCGGVLHNDGPGGTAVGEIGTCTSDGGNLRIKVTFTNLGDGTCRMDYTYYAFHFGAWVGEHGTWGGFTGPVFTVTGLREFGAGYCGILILDGAEISNVNVSYEY